MLNLLKTAPAAALLFFGSISIAAENPSDKKDPLLIYRNAGVGLDQEAKIRQLAQEYDRAGRVRVERLRNLSKQIKDLSFDADLDESKILGLQTEINDIQNAINTERTKLMLRIRGLLTEEQREKFVELMRERDPQAPPRKPKAEKPVQGTSEGGSSSPSQANPSPAPSPQ